LASSLRGKARAVLNGIFEIENLKFEELRSRLELHYGKRHLSQTNYTQFTNRRQKSAEDLASLGSDIERLSRLAYPECIKEVRDEIACAQFIAVLSNGFIKRTLQLEGVVSLRLTVERAMAIKAIQGNSFIKRNKEKNDFCKEGGKNKFNNRNYEISLNAKENKDKTGGKFNRFQKKKKFLSKRNADSVANKDISVLNVFLL